LVQRATERELYKFFRKQGLKVNEVILLRDRRSNRHKGCAYVEMRKMDDVPKAVALSNTVPTFQRFPILVKASEAEKNYLAQASSSSTTDTTSGSATPVTVARGTKGVNGSSKNGAAAPITKNLVAKPPPLLGPNGKLLEAQKVYVGSLDSSVTQEHLFLLYSQFGYLDKVALQMDSNTGISKGFAFLSFHDPKDAFLAIQTMNGQVLAGRPMKTGWAVNQIPSIPGAEVITAEEFPADASARTASAYRVLAQLVMGVGLGQIREALTTGVNPAPVAPTASRVPTVADARASLAATSLPVAVAAIPQSTPVQTVTPSPTMKQVGRADTPTPYILVHNMYDKDEETEVGWETEIKEEFEEECSQYGKILAVKVMSKEPGGKIYASFESVDGAQKCASSIAG
jgi:RNA-binding protein 39